MDMTTRRGRNSKGCDLGRRIRYEPGPDEPLSIAAATALAKYHGEDVTTANTQLYDFIDPEALDALFADTCRGGVRSSGVVEFETTEFRMTIEADCIEVTPAN